MEMVSSSLAEWIRVTVSAQSVRTQTERTQIMKASAEGLQSEAIEVMPDCWTRKRELTASVTPDPAT
jgi:hypothetical protein